MTEEKVKSVEPSKEEAEALDKMLKRDQEEFGGFNFDGNVYDSDTLSQQRIQGASQLAMLDDSISMEWTTQDNQFVILLAPDLIRLGVAMATHINTQHGIARQLRTQLDSATTVAEVEAISWPSP